MPTAYSVWRVFFFESISDILPLKYRRVETETSPLVTEGKVPWKRIDDDTLFKGQKVVEQYGTPPRSTSVRRRVFAPNGSLMYDTTWHSYYVGEPTVVRIGTKQRPKKPAKTAPEDKKHGPSAGEGSTDGAQPPTSTSPTTASTR